MSKPQPHHDCPACPDCGSSLGTPTREVERWDGPRDATLFCPACGVGWVGTAVDVEQAERAWAAWEAHEDNR